jgi:predicted enzyme related to lactoylglutathione lyase
MELLFAGVAVAKFPEAVEWYGRLFGRPADVVVVENQEVMWRVAGTGWLYVVRDRPRSGQGLVAISVSDLDEAMTDLGARGVGIGRVESVGDGGRKATTTDPDGNTVALIQVVAS